MKRWSFVFTFFIYFNLAYGLDTQKIKDHLKSLPAANLHFMGEDIPVWIQKKTNPPSIQKCPENCIEEPRIISRQEWKAEPLRVNDESWKCINYNSHKEAFAKFRSKPVQKVDIKDIYQGSRIIIHHTAMPDPNIGVKELEAMALNTEGDNLIAFKYHFYISHDGKIFEGRPLYLAGAHAGQSLEKITCKDGIRHREFNLDYDYRSIGIAIHGDYSKNPTNKEEVYLQIRKSLYWILKSWQEVDKAMVEFKRNPQKTKERFSFDIFLVNLIDMYTKKEELSTTAKYKALVKLIKYIGYKYDIDEVVGHKHVRHEGTECPGIRVLEALRKTAKKDKSFPLLKFNDSLLGTDNNLKPIIQCKYKSKLCSDDSSNTRVIND